MNGVPDVASVHAMSSADVWMVLGTWVGGIGSAVAAGVALKLGWSARTAAEAHRVADGRRVYGWGTADGQRGHFTIKAFVQNATETPLLNVAVNLLTASNLPFPGVATSVPAIAPGQTAEINMRLPWVGQLANPPLYVVVTFRDADGVLCQRHPDGSFNVGVESVRLPKRLDG